jgi:quinoprotein glucose dehydrogenase
VLWALWEVGLNGWALVPRVIAPAVLLVLVLAALPVVDPGPPGRRKSLVGFAALAVFLIVGGVVVADANKARIDGPLPAVAAMSDSDPSLLRVGADWPAYGGTYAGQRYSPLSQLNPTTPATCVGCG